MTREEVVRERDLVADKIKVVQDLEKELMDEKIALEKAKA